MENTQELNEQSVSELQLLDVFYNIMAFIPYLSEDYLNMFFSFIVCIEFNTPQIQNLSVLCSII